MFNNSVLKKLAANSKPVLFIGLSLATGFANYLFFPVSKRLLGIEKFSTIVVYTSIIAVFGAVLAAQQFYAISHLARLSHERQLDVMLALRTKATIFIASLSVVYLLLGWPVFHALHINDGKSFWLILVCLWVLTSANLVASYWQAKAHFLKVGLFTLLSSIAQLGLTIMLLNHNPLSYKAILGLILGQIITMAFVVMYFKDVRHFITAKAKRLPMSGAHTKELLKITGIVLLLYLFLNFDVFVTKRYLSSETTGLYGTFSTIMKVLFFVISPLVTIFLPKIAGLSKKQYRRELQILVTWVAISSLLLSLGASLLFSPILRIVYGISASQLHGLRVMILPMLLAIASIYTTVVVLVIRKDYRPALSVAGISLVGAVIAAGLLHKTMNLGPLAITIGALCGLVALGVWYLYRKYAPVTQPVS